jgi:hypothetical protein
MATLNARQIGEFEARDFLGEETWKRWKADYDSLMAYRKTIKGKPDEAQAFILQMNAKWIEYYGSVLFHSVSLSRRNGQPGGLCACTRCGQRRNAAKDAAEERLVDGG